MKNSILNREIIFPHDLYLLLLYADGEYKNRSNKLKNIQTRFAPFLEFL